MNPWRTHSRFLVSHNLLVDPTYADPMREWLGGLLPGSLLILDEAHHAAPSSGGRYGIETKFTRAVRDLCGRFEHRLFLSATPHNGHSNSFSTLLELLDPYRFTRGVKIRGKGELEEVMVRRLKEDIREIQGGFPRRNVERVVIDDLPADAPEILLSELLDQYRTTREERHETTSQRAPGPRPGCSSSGCSNGCSPPSRPSRAPSRCIGAPHWSRGKSSSRKRPKPECPTQRRNPTSFGRRPARTTSAASGRRTRRRPKKRRRRERRRSLPRLRP